MNWTVRFIESAALSSCEWSGCPGGVCSSSSFSWTGYRQIFWTGLSRIPSSGIRAIPRFSRHACLKDTPIYFYFLPARRCASAVLAVALCLSVCPSVRYKSMFYQNGFTDRCGYWHRGYLQSSSVIITPILRSLSLQWLKITKRIEYKLLSLTYKVLTTTQPPYFHKLISTQRPRSTCSSSYRYSCSTTDIILS